MEKPQSYAHHARIDPPFHYVILPVTAITSIAIIVRAVREPNLWTIWLVVVALAGCVLVLKTRLYALKVQDRVIRLEERLRMTSVLPDVMRARVDELTDDQLIGLRFASNEELPALCRRALDEKLNRRQIKQAVTKWRSDYLRV